MGMILEHWNGSQPAEEDCCNLPVCYKKMILCDMPSIFLFCLILISTTAQEWNYDPCTDGPATWSSDYPLCGLGLHQSPVDVSTFSVNQDPSLTPLIFNWGQSLGSVYFNGETCQTKIDPNSGSFVTGGPLGGDVFNMIQFHTHEVSEHHIDGMAYPLEIHFVHRNSMGSLAVVGFFFRVTPNNSTFIGEFVDFCVSNGTSDNLDFSSLLNSFTSINIPYYTYSGSLTTPPCSENVTWILISEEFQVSRAQLNQFMGILPNHIANNRPIQPLNDRIVRYYTGLTQVTEIGLLYELCELNTPLLPYEQRQNWQNMFLTTIGGLAPNQTVFGVFTAYDPSAAITNLNYVRLQFNDLSTDSVLIAIRQVHTTTAVQTKSGFFSMSVAQRLQYYQAWLPNNQPHNSDITYPPTQTVSYCAGGFTCGYVLNNPQVTDQSDVLPVFIFSITNIGGKPIAANTVVSAFAGDKDPNCRGAPVGIILGSLWVAIILMIVVATVLVLAWEKMLIQKRNQLSS